jgi:hypothetical protein
MDPNTAAAWRDLYIGTVGAGAARTGLTFVAIALDPHQIERTPLLRLRAASALWYLSGESAVAPHTKRIYADLDG